MLALPGAPFAVQYRELWLPRGINENASLPTSVQGGHGLAFTGARRGTTVDGIHFDGTATSNINCGVIHNNIPKLWVSLRFKLDQPFAAGSGNQFIWGKVVDGNNIIDCLLDNGDGRLRFRYYRLAGWDFQLESTAVSWEAGRWYHVICSLSDTAGGIQRLVIDNVAEDTDTQAANNTLAAGDFVFGDRDDPGGGTGFRGVISDFFVGTDDLTVAEEADLYKGIPPADVVNEYLLDEGRGVTAYDRGSGGNNGTLDTSARWQFGQVEAPVISLDSINDRASSAAGVDISGDLTLVWLGKMKSSYDGLTGNHDLFYFRVDANNLLEIWYHTSDYIYWTTMGNGVQGGIVQYGVKPAIDDYWIIITTLTLGGFASLFVNGILRDTNTGTGVISGAGAIISIGSNTTPSNYDISKPLFAALIDGAFTQAQALAYSRYLKKVFNLPIVI